MFFLKLLGRPYLSTFSPCSKHACSFHTTPSISACTAWYSPLGTLYARK
jgi:hypothetical protein